MHIDTLLKEAVKMNASDLHLTVGVSPVFRINGSIQRMEKQKIEREVTKRICQQILSDEKYRIFEEYGEADSSYAIPGFGLFRVNCYRQRGAPGVAIRILNNKVFSLADLELPAVLSDMARNDRGLILVTGPTGSGKSTTMAAMVNMINEEEELHIVTLEDPIEYFHKHKKSIITQREIGRDSNSFPNALRAALRQDPDVIMIGEMRDLETIAIAVTAAETGHLVLGTLHTSDAAQSIERIIDSFPDIQQQQIRAQLASSLIGVASQRLVRRKNGNGRVAAVEILRSNPAVKNLIRERKVHQLNSIMQISNKYGMQTMDKHLKILCDNGTISKQEGILYAKDKEDMTAYLSNSF